jgi:TonB family protein
MQADLMTTMKKQFTVLLGLLFLTVFSFGQVENEIKYIPPEINVDSIDNTVQITIDTITIKNDTIFPYIDDTELFVNFTGGQVALERYLSRNIIYPDSSRNMKIQGHVYVSFFIDEKGKISDAKIIKSVSSDIDKEVLRVVLTMPNWTWNKSLKKENRRKVKKYLGVYFSLTDDKDVIKRK